MKAKAYLQKNREEAKGIIRDYLRNFIKDGCFDEVAYVSSSMEGELVEEINGQMFGDDEGVMGGDDDAYDYVDTLTLKVVNEPEFEVVKDYLSNLDED